MPDPFAPYVVSAPKDDPFAKYVVSPASGGDDDTSDEWARGFGRAVFGSLADSIDPSIIQTAGHGVLGILKGAGHTAETIGKWYHKIPGVSAAVDALYGDAGDGQRDLASLVTGEAPRQGLSTRAFQAADEALKPKGAAEHIGYGAEQAAEYLIPAGAAEHAAASITAKVAPKFVNAPRLVQAATKVIPRAATEAASAAGVAAAQGADPRLAAVAGAVSPVVAEAGGAVAPYLRAKAEALTRAAVKPTVSALRKMAGTGATGLEAQANKLVRFMLDNNITTAEQARMLVADAEKGIQSLVMTRNVPTDAPQRAARYLSALEQSAAKQGLAAGDVAAIRNAGAEVLEGVMGKDVVTMVPTPHPTLVQPNGQPFTVMVPQTTRALRTDMMADEALASARSSSQWSTRKQWGEQKGATMEATKAVERAQRDAVKAAIPETAPLLQRQQQGLAAADALDRMAQRTANRDTLSLPGVAAAGAEIAAGKVPILGLAAQWLRNNQLRAGVWANRLASAIQRQDVQEVGAILNRFGVGVAAQTGAVR